MCICVYILQFIKYGFSMTSTGRLLQVSRKISQEVARHVGSGSGGGMAKAWLGTVGTVALNDQTWDTWENHQPYIDDHDHYCTSYFQVSNLLNPHIYIYTYIVFDFKCSFNGHFRNRLIGGTYHI